MLYITTTQLRTKSSKLVHDLSLGQVIQLVHRSKIIGELKPKQKNSKILSQIDLKEIIQTVKAAKIPRLSDKQIATRYRNHLKKRYGKNIS